MTRTRVAAALTTAALTVSGVAAAATTNGGDPPARVAALEQAVPTLAERVTVLEKVAQLERDVAALGQRVTKIEGGSPTPTPTATPTATVTTPTTSTTTTSAPTTSTTTATPSPTATATVPAAQTYYLTGYSWYDNTPPGSAAIAYPVLHQQAAGTGTYADPITVAVGHSRATGRSVPIYPPGTRFYLQQHRRYLIVEDACGDGPTPQNGPCYRLPSQYQGKAVAWLDVWVDGKAAGRAASDRCMNRLTGLTPVIKDPPDGLPVTPGPLC